MLDAIKFSEELSIYTTKISDIDNEQLSKDLELNCNINKNLIKGDNIPGIQSDIIITSKNIQDLEIKIIKIILFIRMIRDITLPLRH